MSNLRTNNLSGEQGQNAFRGSVNFVSKTETDYLQVSANSDLSLTGDFTIEYWAWISDSETHTRQVSSGNYYTAGKNGNWYFGLSPTSGNVIFYTYDAQSNPEFVNISQTISLNSWHHAAAVRSGNTVTLYLNGISIGSGTVSKDLVDGADGGLQIGRLTTYGSHMGYISNFRILNGEALYTANFTPPFTELKAIPNTVLLCCQNSDDVTQEETGKTITGNGNLANADFNKSQPKIIPPYGVDAGNTFGGPIQQSSQGYMYFPTGRTDERGRGRGLHAGGENPSHCNIIDFIQIQSGGISEDFGDLITVSNSCDGVSSKTRAVFATYDAPTYNSLEFVTMATTGNATDFGDQTISTGQEGTLSNDTRGLFAGGYGGSAQIFRSTVEFITIATTGNATDFGDLREAIVGVGGASDTTRGLFAGGVVPGAYRNSIDQFTIGTTGNATDFGDLTVARRNPAGTSDSTRGVFFGGNDSGGTNVIDFVTIQSAGNATDFGDSTSNQADASGCSDNIRGVFSAGYYGSPNLSNVIEKVIIQTTGNSVDYGDLIDERIQGGSVSDSHGGLE